MFTGVGLTIAEYNLVIPQLVNSLADGGYNGLFFGATVDASVNAITDLVYKNADGTYHLATAAAGTPISANAFVVALSPTPLLMSTGFFRHTAWSLTAGAGLYLSPGTPGSLTTTQPSTSGQMVQPLGYAYSADTIYFNSSQIYLTLL